MAEFPALPLFTDAYLGDTTHLTTVEHGAYLLLLMQAWRSGGTLPNDDRLLARFTRLTGAQWTRIKPTIIDFFVVEKGVLIQRRLRDELNHVRQVRDKRRDAAGAKWLKHKGRHSANAEQMQCITDAPTPTPTPTPTLEEEQRDLTVSLVVSDEATEPVLEEDDALTPEEVIEAWNNLASDLNLPVVRGKLNRTRMAHLKARIREHPFEEWSEALAAIRRSPFLRGEGPRGWRANFDFLLQPSSFTKLLEGQFDDAETAH